MLWLSNKSKFWYHHSNKLLCDISFSEALVGMGYSRSEIEDSLAQAKYDDVFATYLLLGRKNTDVSIPLTQLNGMLWFSWRVINIAPLFSLKVTVHGQEVRCRYGTFHLVPFSLVVRNHPHMAIAVCTALSQPRTPNPAGGPHLVGKPCVSRTPRA